MLVIFSGTASTTSSTKITAIGAENEYANVIAQVGGKYVNSAARRGGPGGRQEFPVNVVTSESVSEERAIRPPAARLIPY